MNNITKNIVKMCDRGVKYLRIFRAHVASAIYAKIKSDKIRYTYYIIQLSERVNYRVYRANNK